MESWVQFGGLVISVVAIVVSLLTYGISNLRDRKKWERDALLEAVVSFVDGSFARYSERAFTIRQAQLSGKIGVSPKLEEYRQRADAGHRQQNIALTRIRLLAHLDVVQAAEDLVAADHRVEAWFLSTDSTSTSWGELNGKRRDLRVGFISAYRKKFGLGTAAPIRSDLRPDDSTSTA